MASLEDWNFTTKLYPRTCEMDGVDFRRLQAFFCARENHVSWAEESGSPALS